MRIKFYQILRYKLLKAEVIVKILTKTEWQDKMRYQILEIKNSNLGEINHTKIKF